MASKRRTQETTEQTLDRWLTGQAKMTSADRAQFDAEWEAGQVGHITVNNAHYERFDLARGGYVVVEWDDEGNISVGP